MKAIARESAGGGVSQWLPMAIDGHPRARLEIGQLVEKARRAANPEVDIGNDLARPVPGAVRLPIDVGRIVAGEGAPLEIAGGVNLHAQMLGLRVVLRIELLVDGADRSLDNASLITVDDAFVALGAFGPVRVEVSDLAIAAPACEPFRELGIRQVIGLAAKASSFPPGIGRPALSMIERAWAKRSSQPSVVNTCRRHHISTFRNSARFTLPPSPVVKMCRCPLHA